MTTNSKKALPESLWLGKKCTMSCQAIIRDERNEELKAIFDVPKEFWNMWEQILEHYWG
jgi:hypothetical protein